MIENGSWRVRLGRTVSRFAIMMLIVLGVVSRSTVLAADERKHKGSDDRDHSGWADREHEGSGDREHEGWDGREHEGSGKKVVLAHDWSHKHLVYSAPNNVTHAFSLSRDTRYVQQWVRRNAEQRERGTWRHQEELLNGDWSMFLGNGGTVGADRYPAKFSFDVTTANCSTAAKPDFVVYNTGLVPSAAAKSASQTATFNSAPVDGNTVQINNPNTGGAITLTARTTPTLPTEYQIGATTTIDATNLAAAITSNGAAVGVTASASGIIVTITSTNVGTADNSISVASNNATAPAVGGIGLLAGGTNGASIVAFDNLYAGGCTGTVPSVFWAYNTGGTISTSVALSGDGSQVAFVQSNGSALAELVLLKWAASATATVNSPVTLTGVAAAAYRTCVAPCMTVISITLGAGGTTDSISSPFYDFAVGSDKLYVGDDTGHLFQFTGVFAGTPAQSAAPWPVTLGTTTTTSPVFDQGTGKVYIADAGGFLYAVTVASGAMIKSAQLAAASIGFAGAPMVDSGNGNVYLFASDNNPAGTNCGGAGAVPKVYQVPVGFAAGAGASSTATIGACSDAIPVYDGDFDNAYYISANGTGNMYVCGNPGGVPTLYQITVTAGALGAVNTGPALGTLNFTCSPVTEVNNPNAVGGAKDWVFMSVQNSAVTAVPISCPAAAGCIMSFDVTLGAAITPATATAARASAPGGASGVVLDNTVSAGTLAGASQVYFGTLANGTCGTSGTGGCGVQASQSALF